MLNQKADMADDMLRKRRGCLPYVWRVLMIMGAILLTLIICLTVLVNIGRRYHCVEMPNGFLIGRATVFSSTISPDADVAIKYPDGSIFLRGDRKMDFWDHDSLAGYWGKTPEGRSDRYIYLNDGGLILKSEQPELYQLHYDRKMALHQGSFLSSGGHVVGVFLRLYEDPDSRRYWCPTAFAWPQKAEWFFPYAPPSR